MSILEGGSHSQSLSREPLTARYLGETRMEPSTKGSCAQLQRIQHTSYMDSFLPLPSHPIEQQPGPDPQTASSLDHFSQHPHDALCWTPSAPLLPSPHHSTQHPTSRGGVHPCRSHGTVPWSLSKDDCRVSLYMLT